MEQLIPCIPMISQGYFIELVNDLSERRQRSSIILYTPEGNTLNQNELMQMTTAEYQELTAVPDATKTESYAHNFCGPHEMEGAECPNCAQPLLRLLSLDTADPRMQLQPGRFTRLPILYCFRCDLCAGQFSYRIESDHRITILQAHRSNEITWGWGQKEDWTQPTHYPWTPVRLIPLSPIQQEFYAFLNSEDYTEEECTAHFSQSLQFHLWGIQRQLGGQTFLCQGWWEFPCSSCGREMPFLLSLNDDCLIERGFTGEDIQLLVAYCQACHVVGVRQVSWT